MPNSKEDSSLIDEFALRDDAPFYGSAHDLLEFLEVAKACISAIRKTDEPRQVVLETWLLVDYAIRLQLSKLWNLAEFNDDDSNFDLRYELLPNFERCLRLLERILSIQRSLRNRPEDPATYGMKMSIGLTLFFKQKFPKELAMLMEIEEKYLEERFPEWAKQKKEAVFTVSTVSKASLLSPSKERYCVNRQWVDSLQSLDENWIRLARKLNKARNQAAHSYDRHKILSAFGYSGPGASKLTKEDCIKMIDTLLGLSETTLEDSSHTEKEGHDGVAR